MCPNPAQIPGQLNTCTSGTSKGGLSTSLCHRTGITQWQLPTKFFAIATDGSSSTSVAWCLTAAKDTWAPCCTYAVLCGCLLPLEICFGHITGPCRCGLIFCIVSVSSPLLCHHGCCPASPQNCMLPATRIILICVVVGLGHSDLYIVLCFVMIILAIVSFSHVITSIWCNSVRPLVALHCVCLLTYLIVHHYTCTCIVTTN